MEIKINKEVIRMTIKNSGSSSRVKIAAPNLINPSNN
jgi:hypothetical protein